MRFPSIPSPRFNLWFPALAGTIAIEHLGQMTDHVLIHCFIRPKLLSFADRAAHVPFLNVLDVLVKDWIPLIDEYHYCTCPLFPSRSSPLLPRSSIGTLSPSA